MTQVSCEAITIAAARADAAGAARPTVLILIGASGRGHPAAGPMQSLLSTVELLSDGFAFKVVAHPATFGEPDAEASAGWIARNRAEFFWLRPSLGGLYQLAVLLRRTRYGLLVLNSIFDRECTLPALLLRRLGFVPRRPTILVPHGELSPAALALKSRRKRAYLALARRLGLLDGLRFQATSAQEAADIARECPGTGRIAVAPLPRALRPLPPHAPSADGRLRLVFLSRIDRMKNLDYALRALAVVRAPVALDIIGPVTHRDHWADCQRLIAVLPPHVSVRYRGAIPNAAVPDVLACYDLFVLPTRGENFGHAILDALESGTPVLISDRTPWQDLERREAGWSLPLAEPHRFAQVIDRFAAMGPDSRQRFRHGARRFAERQVADDDAVPRTRTVLFEALAAAER